ncbi:thioredoxin reductase [Algoriphagus sp. 4150]|uniref:ArsO family NAD(P)H-dependent flavin-containing monooxygenase n=1 Tax=Algoriphagus sp. 4150 TaxID=2817756 RepID=UPI00286108D3|nr:ArsO family NAD(P)H-dependent flavin-containing monooxygenase [Algoriphagus sp. 4150]MDR7130918.1 thioredoxin reductase [Algoriphagus sp. 4150]
MKKEVELIVIGGGQSALACGYFLRRTGLDYLILDDKETCGGSWPQTWESLTLFSPAKFSSLPGFMMPASVGEYPSREEVISYLCAYERRYDFPIERGVRVTQVTREDGVFIIHTEEGQQVKTKAVISATGTWQNPFIPEVSGRERFQGLQMHSKEYQNSKAFEGKRVLIVGEGNTGAQLLAEVSKVAQTVWATHKQPEFLPDDVDGRVLFDLATAKYEAEKLGKPFDSSRYHLGNIVMTPSVKEARGRAVLSSKGRISVLEETAVVWENGERDEIDAILWCTGFGFATGHLSDLVSVDVRGRISTEETRCKDVPGLWTVGYGGWTGFASATLIGVGRSARQTVKEVVDYIKEIK